jgi:hypothetical protein
LQQELELRQSRLQDLIRQRDELNAELELLGGPGAYVTIKTVNVHRGGTRLRNRQSLVGSLQKVLAGKSMSVQELEAAVKKSGYKTKSSNFRVIVNQTLIAHPKVFRKVDRGVYTVR